MAVAEHVGHDRRGVTVIAETPTGSRSGVTRSKKWLSDATARTSSTAATMRRRVLADDLPLIADGLRSVGRDRELTPAGDGVAMTASAFVAPRRWLAEEASGSMRAASAAAGSRRASGLPRAGLGRAPLKRVARIFCGLVRTSLRHAIAPRRAAPLTAQTSCSPTSPGYLALARATANLADLTLEPAGHSSRAQERSAASPTSGRDGWDGGLART